MGTVERLSITEGRSARTYCKLCGGHVNVGRGDLSAEDLRETEWIRDIEERMSEQAMGGELWGSTNNEKTRERKQKMAKVGFNGQVAWNWEERTEK